MMMHVTKRSLILTLLSLMWSLSVFGISEQHFTFEELNAKLAGINGPTSLDEQDNRYKWDDKVTIFRSIVSESFNAGLASLIDDLPADVPIVEIGSGSTYKLPENRVIRLQPNTKDFVKLEGQRGAYPISLETFTQVIASSPERRVPAYFALNVFDTMPEQTRIANLKAIESTQASGDVLFVVSDLNPFVRTTVAEMSTDFPNHIVYPYFPDPNDSLDKNLNSQISAVLLPKEMPEFNELTNFSSIQFEKALLFGMQLISRDLISGNMLAIAELKKRESFRVVALEDYYSQKMKALLSNSYDVQISYQAYFKRVSSESLKRGPGSSVKQAVVYKPVSDNGAAIRQWSCTDPDFIARLASKKISLPNDCVDESLLKAQEKLVGAEFLVIKAVRK